MRKFKTNQRVMVTEGPLARKTGTVRRVRINDDAAWVEIDGGDIPPELREFPEDDPHGRGNQVILYPRHCIGLRVFR